MALLRTLRLLAVSSVVTALVGASAALSATAAPLEREQFHETSSEVVEDCGLTIRIDEEVRGTFLLNTRGKDKLPYGMETVRGSASFTNLATGKSYSTDFNVLFKDHKITDNGDGTFTILVLATGNEKWYGPDGKVLFRNPGQVRFEILIDHGGTPGDPSDDEFLEFLGIVKGSTGRNDLEGRDFCDDLVEFTS